MKLDGNQNRGDDKTQERDNAKQKVPLRTALLSFLSRLMLKSPDGLLVGGID